MNYKPIVFTYLAKASQTIGLVHGFAIISLVEMCLRTTSF